MNGDELGQLRTEIDSLDEELIKILALRFIATSKVGIIKAAKSLEAVDPSREAIQAQRYSVLAAQYGVSIELIQKVFRTVIDEVVANHQAIRESTLSSLECNKCRSLDKLAPIVPLLSLRRHFKRLKPRTHLHTTSLQ